MLRYFCVTAAGLKDLSLFLHPNDRTRMTEQWRETIRLADSFRRHVAPARRAQGAGAARRAHPVSTGAHSSVAASLEDSGEQKWQRFCVFFMTILCWFSVERAAR
jgi:hypothetical protein